MPRSQTTGGLSKRGTIDYQWCEGETDTFLKMMESNRDGPGVGVGVGVGVAGGGSADESCKLPKTFQWVVNFHFGSSPRSFSFSPQQQPRGLGPSSDHLLSHALPLSPLSLSHRSEKSASNEYIDILTTATNRHHTPNTITTQEECINKKKKIQKKKAKKKIGTENDQPENKAKATWK